MLFLLLQKHLASIYVQGENYLDVLGINQSINQTIQQFTYLNDFQYVDQIHLSQYNGYIFQNQNIYISGNAYQLEGLQNKQSSLEPSQYLVSSNIQNMMNSLYHTIILYKNNTIVTIGNNENGQLGRVTTADYSQDAITFPVINPIQVGALKNLSFIVNETHIFFTGKCSDCLCGMQNGTQDTSQYDDWQNANLSGLQHKKIAKIHFGHAQFVVQTKDNKLYYIGSARHFQACTAQQQVCEFHQLPFDYKDSFTVSDYSISYLHNNNIHFCGCTDFPTCSNQSQTIVQLSQNSFTDMILDYSAANSWIIITTKQILLYNYQQSGEQAVNINVTHTDPHFPTNVDSSKYGNMIYSRPRYLHVQVSGLCDIILNNKTYTLQTTNESLFVPYSLCSPNQNLNITISSTQYMPQFDSIRLGKGNASVSYTLTPRTNFSIIYTFIDVQNNPVKNVTISIQSSLYNQQIYNQTQQQSSGTVTIEPVNTGLNDTWIMEIIPQNASLFPQQATQQLTQTTVTLNLTFQTHFNYTFHFVDTQTNQSIVNLPVSITYNTTTSIVLTDANGNAVISIEKMIYDQLPNIQFNITYSGNATYHAKDLVLNISRNTTQVQKVEINPILTFNVIINVNPQAVGNIQITNPSNNSVICAQGALTQTSTLQLSFNQSVCNISVSTSLLVEFYDSSLQFFTTNNSYPMELNTNINLNIVNNNYTTDIVFHDQYNVPVTNYNTQYSVDNTTFTSQLTSATGQISFNVTLTNIQNTTQSVFVKGTNDTIYKSLPLKQISLQDLISQVQLQVQKYVTFNVTLEVVDSLTNQTVSNIKAGIYSQSNNSLLLNGTTNAQGVLTFMVKEIDQILEFNNTYNVQLNDYSGNYKPYNTTLYVSQENITVRCLLNAKRVRFYLFDVVANQTAIGCEMTLYTDIDTITKSSNNNGRIQFDVVGTITNNIRYSITGTDVYKPIDNATIAYNTGYIQINVSTYLNFSLVLIIQDGVNYSYISDLNVSLYTQLGDLKYNSFSDKDGKVYIDCSEKDDIVQLNTVYNLTIVDTLPRYHKQSRNYTVRTVDQSTIVYMNLQMLVVTVVNYEAIRIPNVMVYVYSNGIEVGEELTNPLGVSQFYLREDQYKGKTITYYVNQSEHYRPSNGQIKIEIKNQPQQAIRRVTPLLIFNYSIHLNPVIIKQNCTQNKNQQNNCTNITVNTPGQFLVRFLTQKKELVYQTFIYEINQTQSYLFIENINQTFKLSTMYSLELMDETNFYETILITFDTKDVFKEFNIQLKIKKPQKFQFPIYGYVVIITGSATIAFIPFVITKYLKFKKQYRAENNIVSRLRTIEEKDAEQNYLENRLKDFLYNDDKEIQRAHTIVRNQKTQSELDRYFTLTGFQTELFSTDTIWSIPQNGTDFMIDK